VLKCLRKNPAERFASADELGAELLGIRGGYPSSSGGRTIGRVKPAVAGGMALKRGRILLYAAVLVCALVALSLLPPGRPIVDTEKIAQLIGLKGLPVARYVVLLPLSVAGGDRETQALADGLLEVQTRKMAWIDGVTDSFWVAPFSDVVGGKILTPREAREFLGANLAIAGGLEATGDLLNLTLNLIDTRTGVKLKTRRLGDPIANLSTWQDSVAVVMARMAGVAPVEADLVGIRRGCTTVPSAFRSYVVGRGFLYPCVGEEDLDAAAASAADAVSEDPSFAMGHAGLGEVYWRRLVATKDTAWAREAILCCEQSIRLDPGLALPYVIAGLVRMERHNPEQAVGYFEKAASVDSTCVEAYNRMARAYRLIGKDDLAIAAIKHSIRLRPKAYNSYNWLGSVYLSRGEYENALKPYRAMIDLLPRKTAGYTNLGATYFALERWADAEDMFKRASEIEPQYFTYSNLGTIAFYQGRYADAAAMYKKALEISDSDYKIWGNYAEACYWTPGQKDKAAAIYQAAAGLAEKEVEEDPDDISVQADLASYYGTMGDETRSLSYLERVIASNPTDVDVIFRVAETCEELGRREQALEWIGKALEQGCSPTRIDRYPGLRALRGDQRFEKLKLRSRA
jgi:tetratricopeptide (TPR) repeat protein/TolB-like protein